MSRVTFETISSSAFDLVKGLNDKSLHIPPHQRAGDCWKLAKRQRFVETVQLGYPTAGILQRVKCGVISLEDGLQRITTLSDYRAGKFADKNGKKFADLMLDMRQKMDDYLFSGTCYSGATDQEAIELFDRFQNGTPLSMGERMNALAKLNPAGPVATAVRVLLTPGQGVYDRMTGVWGKRIASTARYAVLRDAVVLIITLAFGETTRKWDDLTEKEDKKYLYKSLPREMTDGVLIEKLNWLISIYEEVERRQHATGKSLLNTQWDMGKFNAYILWSLKHFPAERERLFTRWVEFLVEWRKDKRLLKELLQKDATAAGSWTDARWEAGYKRVFTPDAPIAPLAEDDDDDEEYDDDDE
jgi:hypothetical protein